MLGLGCDLRAEHPYLMATLLEPGGDARDVTPDAAGTSSQQLRDLHDEPTSAEDVRRRSAHIWASTEGARSRSIAVNTKTQSRAKAHAPNTATAMPTSVSSREPAAPTPPARTQAASPTNIGLPNTLPASAGTSQGPGTTRRRTATLMITAAHAVALATPDALPWCWASKVREASPSNVKPTTAGANATIGHANAWVRSEPGPNTNTRATGTAVATSKAAPSQAITTVAGPVSESTRMTSARPCSAAAASRGNVSCSSGAANTAYGSR